MLGAGYWKQQGVLVELDGITYSSKVEARWAVFINSLGYEFEHERQVFVPDRTYQDGGFLLHPDFWIPEINLWCEIKHDTEGVDEDIYRASLFIDSQYQTCSFLIGPPTNKPFLCYSPSITTENNLESYSIAEIFDKPPSDIRTAIRLSKENETINSATRPEKFVPDTHGKIDKRGIKVLDEDGPDDDERQWNYAARNSDRENRQSYVEQLRPKNNVETYNHPDNSYYHANLKCDLVSRRKINQMEEVDQSDIDLRSLQPCANCAVERVQS